MDSALSESYEVTFFGNVGGFGLYHLWYFLGGVIFYICTPLGYIYNCHQLVDHFRGLLISHYLLVSLMNSLIIVIAYPCFSVRDFSSWSMLTLFSSFCWFMNTIFPFILIVYLKSLLSVFMGGLFPDTIYPWIIISRLSLYQIMVHIFLIS